MTRYLAGLVVGTVFALGYVQQRVCLVRLGYDVESAAAVRDELLDQNRVLQYNVLALQSPVILEERLARSEVWLAPPAAVEVLSPLIPTASSVPPWGGSAGSEPSWFDQALTFAGRWLEREARAER